MKFDNFPFNCKGAFSFSTHIFPLGFNLIRYVITVIESFVWFSKLEVLCKYFFNLVNIKSLYFVLFLKSLELKEGVLSFYRSWEVSKTAK